MMIVVIGGMMMMMIGKKKSSLDSGNDIPEHGPGYGHVL